MENKNNSIQQISPLESPWATQDPFIFCAYHFDMYTGRNDNNGPIDSLEGRNIGQDFSSKDGWSMYHGSKVPGFPYHPHRGFETVSIVKQGTIDHSDSVGGLGRFKKGDVQWLTSGKGVQHAEMFPLLNEKTNPLEMFQIWLNLPKKSKFVDPHYKMLWKEDIPQIIEKDALGNKTIIDLIAGKYGNETAISPTPDSWAADATNYVQIWTVEMEPNAEFQIPEEDKDLNRAIYFYDGASLTIDDNKVLVKNRIELNSDKKIKIKNGTSRGFFLFLQGKPINEPVVRHGPFVMNTKDEIREAMKSYQQTQFGGWPWESNEPTHHKEKGRFAIYPDGTEETML